MGEYSALLPEDAGVAAWRYIEWFKFCSSRAISAGLGSRLPGYQVRVKVEAPSCPGGLGTRCRGAGGVMQRDGAMAAWGA
ncbi:hypothetical protein NDU88_001453 [Pleurodeles waltl]|uniref:Uncharacterized protein n=1 Tax=Pleurodeles waltl TaxID=8319 RepID=A0AAV7M0I7_PLEWA|nr:hypothetical protein NDU88_001453 [Pleurodeles waltl]